MRGKPQNIALALASVYANVLAVREVYQQAIDAIDYAVKQQQLISKQN